MAKFNILKVAHGFFDEIAQTLVYGLRGLGHEAGTCKDWRWPGTYIVLGAHLVRTDWIPSGSILYNFEQVGRIPSDQYGIGERCTIWDYSASNITHWREHGIAAKHVELGYVPELTRIPQRDEDIDVLFYGASNERREGVIRALCQAGKHVVDLSSLFGEQRDLFIAKAKLVLNVHFYETKTFEIARVSYLLANRKTVVTEESSNEADYQYLDGGMVSVPYDGLVTACLELLDDPGRRKQVGELGFEKFSQRSEVEILKNALA